MHEPNCRTEEDVRIQLTALQKKKKLSLIPMIVGCAMLVLCVLQILGAIGESFVAAFMLIGMACLLLGILLNTRLSKKIKGLIASSIIPATLETVFDHVFYRHDAHISDAIVENIDMGFPFSFDKIRGSDYIRATYHGLHIELSDLELIRITEHVDSDGHVHQDEETVFCGMYLICDFGKPLSADLLLAERKGKLSKLTSRLFHSKNEIQTESAEFNEKFRICSDSAHDAFYILTPHMMEYILSMDTKGKGDTYMRFLQAGKVHIAINSRRNAFEIKDRYSVDQLKEQFLSEIKYITDIIDELRLVDTIYK